MTADDPAGAFRRVVALARSLDRPEHFLAMAGVIKTLAASAVQVPRRRVAVAGDCTVDAIAAALAVALAAEGVLAEMLITPFGTINTQILDPASELHAFTPEIALTVPAPRSARDGAAEDWCRLWRALAERHPAVRILHHLYEEPEEDFTGPAEGRTEWAALSLSRRVNEAIVAAAPGFVHLIDLNRLAARVGRLSFVDPRLWFHGKLPFALKHVPEYSLYISGAVCRALGRSRKALVVDLDNTLWGGIVGDDGIEGIRLGPGDPVGEAHAAFCSYLKELAARGVILAIASKNDPEIALEVFDSHRHMPLRRSDFAAIRCSWDNKADNLRAIAKELNIDVSALVFADDNPAECELVRRELPEVVVVELSGDASGFVRKLDRMRLFEHDTLSAEDLGRTAAYQARGAAELARGQSANLEDYLMSLDMRGEVWAARERDLTRLAQMEAKTNQFNLTTKRWSIEQLTMFMDSPDHDVLCFRLVDRFADHGLVSSVVLRYGSGRAEILSWLMSCRIFSRTAEEFIFAAAIGRARARGATSLIGRYVASAKNSVAAGLYPRMGFAEVENGNFRLEIDSAQLPSSFIRPFSFAAEGQV